MDLTEGMRRLSKVKTVTRGEGKEDEDEIEDQENSGTIVASLSLAEESTDEKILYVSQQSFRPETLVGTLPSVTG